MARMAKLVPPAKSWMALEISREKAHNGHCAKLTGELVKLQGEGDGEEEELVGDGEDGRDGQVVVVEHMDRRHGVCFFGGGNW